jgi:hypothetical protein
MVRFSTRCTYPSPAEGEDHTVAAESITLMPRVKFNEMY